MKRRSVAACILAAVVIAGCAGHGWFSHSHGSANLTLYGNVDIRSVDLGFRVPGRIASMPVDEGAKVKAGDVLARLDTQPLTDQLNAAEAQVHAAKAELDKRHNGNRVQDIAQA